MYEFDPTQAFVLAVGAMITGIIMLIKGGGWSIGSAVFIARRYGLSPLIVGFTIIAFGTSLPELVVSVLANLDDSAGIALGNVLGSNIANILLVIGVTALFGTLVSSGRAVVRDLIMMMVATLILTGFLVSGSIPQWAGFTMIALLLTYVFMQYMLARRGEVPISEEDDPEFSSMKMAALSLVIGLIGIALGAEFLVRGAKVSAAVIGVPEAVIALSVIAFGTSLPELSTCIIAARRKHTEIVLGNIIGSNVFNVLMIIGTTTAIKPILPGSFSPQLANFDVWLTLLVSFVFALIVVFYKRIGRKIGLVFVGAYVVYNITIYLMHMGL